MLLIMDYELFEALPPEQDKKVAFTVGRYNPPTRGHYKLIDKMKDFIRDNKDLGLEATPVVVVIEGEQSSQDKQKNPLTGDERVSFMKASGRANGVVFLIAKSAFFALGKIRDAGYEPIAVAAGTDRAEGYLKMLNKSFKHEDGSDIEHVVIPGLDRTDDAAITKKADKKVATDATLDKLQHDGNITDEEVSGSIARRAVELDYFDEFTKIVGLEKKQELARMMFNKIRKAIGLS